MIVVAHLRANRECNAWIGHVSLKEDNPSPQQLAQAAIDVIASSMSMQEGDVVQVFHAPDK